MASRIWFRGNPWPKGHAIKELAWTAAVADDGLRFHLHLETADYYAEDDRDDEDEDVSDWKSRGVWGNYHACTLSSTQWGAAGFLVATERKPIDLNGLAGKTFRIDRFGDAIPRDQPRDELAFGIYVLGHDAVAEHRIAFERRVAPYTYNIRWRARIASAYVGSYDLDHELDATLRAVRFGGVTLRAADDLARARSLLVNGDRFRRSKQRLLPPAKR